MIKLLVACFCFCHIFVEKGFCQLPTTDRKQKPAYGTNILTSEALTNLLKAVREWPDERDQAASYSTWSNVLVAAQAIQKSTSNSVVQSIREYQLGKGHWYITNSDLDHFNNFTRIGEAPFFQEDTKLLLVLIITFDIPESVPLASKDRWSGPPMFSQGRSINTDGTLNLAFPLKWNNGSPYFISEYLGWRGCDTSWDMAAVYHRLSEKYLFRDLSHSVKSN